MQSASATRIEGNVDRAASALFAAAMGYAAFVWFGAHRAQPLLIAETAAVATFAGERHRLSLRVAGSDSHEVAQRMCAGLEDAEFSIPGLLVADIGLAGAARRALDGATDLTIEALTVADD
jgi:hypothetical protein